MAQVHFTSWLRELVPNGPVQAPGVTVGDALAGVFEREPQVRCYVLDDRGRFAKTRLRFRRRHAAAERNRAHAPDPSGGKALRDAGVVRRLERGSSDERSNPAGDAKRAAHAGAQGRRLGGGADRFSRRAGDVGACAIRATARFTPRSSTDISARSCTARTTRAAAGRNLPRPRFAADTPGAPTLFQVWTLEAGGANQPGRLWAGAIPAGLFRSDDRGESWQLVSALWNVPERAKWFGGGYDDAGIHTISPDPRDARRVFVAISCGGVWESRDDGKSWALHGEGMVAAYMPPDQAEYAGSAGPASRGALHRCARRDVDAAPQRHFPLDRYRQDLERSSSRRATISALRSWRIRRTRSPRGSCPG